MTLSPVDPWWSFSLDPAERADAEANRLRGAAGAPLVNAPGEDGRLLIDYAGYLGLDALLGAQHPASSVPDERVFVVVHQLCELVFKQMTFDLAVVAATMERLLRLGAALPAMALDRPAPRGVCRLTRWRGRRSGRAAPHLRATAARNAGAPRRGGPPSAGRATPPPAGRQEEAVRPLF